VVGYVVLEPTREDIDGIQELGDDHYKSIVDGNPERLSMKRIVTIEKQCDSRGPLVGSINMGYFVEYVAKCDLGSPDIYKENIQKSGKRNCQCSMWLCTMHRMFRYPS
jgi:hypothetical protein